MSRTNEQFKYYTLLTVLYTIFIVTAQAMAYRLIQLGPFIEPGGIFIFPATFTVSDMIAEVYGPTLARRTIFFALIAQAFFTVVPIWMNTLPYPSNFEHFEAFQIVFGRSWLVYLSNIVAILVGMVVNVQLIGKTKIWVHGRFFWLRSLCVTAVGEFVLTAIIVLIALVPEVGSKIGWMLFWNMFLFKMVFTCIVLFPASFFVAMLKKVEQIDIYEKNVSINPLNGLVKRKSLGNVVSLSEHVQRKTLV